MTGDLKIIFVIHKFAIEGVKNDVSKIYKILLNA